MLRRGWLVVVAVTAIAAGVAAAVTYARTPLHRAETKVLVAQGGTAGSAAFTRTLAELVRSNIVAQNVIQDLRLPLSAGRLLDRLSVVADPGSAVITIRADDRSRERAQQIVQETALVFVQFVRQRFAELSPDPAKAALGAPTATVFDPAHALGGQLEPDPLRDIGLGAGLGLLLGLLGAFLRAALDRRLGSRAAAAAAFALPVLATVQADTGTWRSLEGDVAGLTTLRASLQLLALHRPLGTLMVAGTTAGVDPVAGLVAAGLAAAYARAGCRTILVECAVRRPLLGEALGLGACSPGLTDVIAGVELGGAIRSAPAGAGEVAVLLAGTPAEGSDADLLGDAAAAMLIDRLSGSYDIVVLAAPALLDGADALELARLADGTLVVGRLGCTTLDDAHRLQELLAGIRLVPLGLVLVAAGRGRSDRWAGAGRSSTVTRPAGFGRRARSAHPAASGSSGES